MAGYCFVTLYYPTGTGYPAMTVTATGTTDPPMAATGEMAATIAATSYDSTATGITGHTGTMEAEIPLYEYSISATGIAPAIGDGTITIPADQYEFTATLLTGMVLSGEINLPPPTITAEGLTGYTGTGEGEYPDYSITASDALASNIVYPDYSLTANGSTGFCGESSSSYSYELSADGTTWEIGNASLVIPVYSVTATGQAGHFISSDITIPVYTASATGLTGETGTASLTYPSHSLAATGITDAANQGSATLVLDGLYSVTGTGYTPTGTPLAIPTSTFVMNTINYAVTEYTNYPFNSFAYFNGIYLGASANGIYRLDQEKDITTNISAHIEKQDMDLGIPQVKKATDAYLQIAADGDIALEMQADELTHTYYVRVKKNEIHNEKVDIGKGLKGRYLGFKVANVRGSDFTLRQVMLLTEIMERRVRAAG